jgi:exonuclease SbcC
MKLVSLELQNFRQHRKTFIKFELGLTAIIGPNGAGKSTLLESISYALFGTKAIRGSIADLPTRGQAKKDTFVELIFEHNALIYRVNRTIQDAEVFIGGEAGAVAKGNKAVTEWLQNLLSMNHEEFVSTYFTEQKGLEFLSGRNGALERSRFILKMMGYDKLEKAQEFLRRDKRDLKNKIITLESSHGSPEKLEEQIKHEKELLDKIQTNLKANQNALKSAEDELEIKLKAKKDMDLSSKTFLTLKDKMLELNTELKVRKQNKTTYLENINGINKKLAEFNLLINKEKFKIENLDEALSHNLNTIRELEASKQSIEKLHIQKNIEAETTKKNLLTNLNQLEQKLEDWKNLGKSAVCPTCEQPLGEHFEDVKAHLIDEELKIKQKINGQEELIKLAKIESKELVELKQVIAEKTIEQNEIKSQINIKKEITKFEQDLRESEKNIEQIVSRIEVIKNEILEFENKIKLINFDEDKYKAVINTYEVAHKLKELAKLNFVKAQADVDKQQALLNRTISELTSWQEKMTQVENFKRELVVLDRSDLLLTDYREYLNKSVRPKLSNLASQFILDLTDGRYSAIDLDENFTPTVIEDGVAKSVISGGEQDILDLCMRLALSQIIADRAGVSIGLLILDEVFGSLDQQRRANVLMLLEKLNNRFEQIILISHLDDVKEGVQHFINVEYDEGAGLVGIENEDLSEDLDLESEVGNT